ncbi:hypothetical protein CRQ31_14345 [Salmonella enterica subsp. enterica serovar Worthington]|uniref:Uncharacterized protein n=1 Tax=Salmonella enterica subsp. enterica serovar Ank TaxID=1173578 RepID=A0A5I2XB15_SALET|nr:hypothetical protein [Salmonella enterica]EBS1325796.1 hypothetical protein [Salmonella enterica subsp. enterica serovar Muenchen]EBV7252030.1 hypothetical protein [Salmonella enterica subsp. enterica serovar Pomona]ECF3886437.1 hypothetical protein [Salmonella enterica subsp. enterica serovar Ank]EDJ9087966.1 hypothetical protein [Salmonella enterica subsp. enterica serovar Vitkin]EGI5053426.1 hypothetical protein [Salmonella enterica subsp. enterica serovar Worthington]
MTDLLVNANGQMLEGNGALFLLVFIVFAFFSFLFSFVAVMAFIIFLRITHYFRRTLSAIRSSRS